MSQGLFNNISGDPVPFCFSALPSSECQLSCLLFTRSLQKLQALHPITPTHRGRNGKVKEGKGKTEKGRERERSEGEGTGGKGTERKGRERRGEERRRHTISDLCVFSRTIKKFLRSACLSSHLIG